MNKQLEHYDMMRKVIKREIDKLDPEVDAVRYKELNSKLHQFTQLINESTTTHWLTELSNDTIEWEDE